MKYKKFPLSSPQREIWFDQILHEDIPLYNRARYIKVPGVINPALLEQAINILIKKHDNLRTILIKNEEGIPLQTYETDINVSVPLWDFSEKVDPDKFTRQWMLERSSEPFTLIGHVLFRFDLIKVSNECYYCLMQYHHLITDGYTNSLLTRSLADIYTQLADQKTPDLKSNPYSHFIDYDAAYANSELFEKKRRYWLEKYSILPAPLFSPRYHINSNDEFIGSQSEILEIPRNLYQELSDFAKQHHVSLFCVLLAIFYVYFTRIGQRDDFTIGIPTLNRVNTEFKKIAGLFTIINPSFFNFGKELIFTELLQKIYQSLKNDLSHQPFTNSEINRSINQGSNYSSLFDISLSYLRFDTDAIFNGIQSETTLLPNLWEQLPLSIYIQDFHQDSDVKIDFIYNLSYFKAHEIKALQNGIMGLLKSILKESNISVCQLPILTEQEILKLQKWNSTKRGYPENKQTIDLFELQVKNTPNQVAITFENKSLSYQELNKKSNQLAYYLDNLKNAQNIKLLKNNPLIAIAIERSLEMVISLLAILKLGGAYIPIDPHYPSERVRYMLEHSAAPLLLTQSHLTKQLPLDTFKHECFIQCIDILNLDLYSPKNLNKRSESHDLAYVIYTSGSTGKPKGVMLEQHNLSNFLQDMQQRLKITSDDKLFAVTTLSFDIAALEIFLPLISGSHLYLANQAMVSDSLALQQQLKKYKISIMQATPATWQLLKHSDWQSENPLTILCGGETLSSELANYLFKNSTFLWNVYGPTETTIWSSAYQIKTVVKSAPSIGQPMANTRLYIVDRDHQILPLDVAGELCIAGAGISRGYLNHPELTAEKFIEIELLGKKERLYKTGDLAKWLPDGNLDYLGRIDHQIKLHGFRIELGEIETSLCLHPAVKEAVAILYEADNNKYLLAYATINTKENTTDDLQLWLKNKLPNYMLPSQICLLDTLPLTANGKIDRLSLPIPNKNNTPQINSPHTVIEERLARIWAETLGIETKNAVGATQVNIHDSFFSMGGHSLFAVQLITQIQKYFKIKVPLRCLFEHPTIAELATYIDSKSKQNLSSKNKSWSALVPLQLTGNKKPVFIMPGGSAGEEELINLVKLVYLLGKERPVYGLQARGWDGLLPPYASVEEMAIDCIKEIRTIQPKGSYLLVGECLGGRVILEIAQQLQAQGEDIEQIILIETVLHDGGKNLKSLMKNIILPKVKRHWEKLSKMTLNHWLNYIFDKSKKAMRILFPKVEFSYNLSEAEKINLYKNTHKNMIFRYQPNVYSGHLHLLMTKKLSKRKIISEWNALATENVSIYTLSGEHEKITYLGEEVETTAKLLKNCLNKI